MTNPPVEDGLTAAAKAEIAAAIAIVREDRFEKYTRTVLKRNSPPVVDPPKVDPPKVDPPKVDPPKVDPPLPPPPKVDPPPDVPPVKKNRWWGDQIDD